MNEDTNARCESCECAFVPKVETERDGEIESVFFRCPYCGERYLIAVTDEELRRHVGEYVQLFEINKAKRLPERTQRRLQKLKEKNVARSRELREMYPLMEESHDGG